MEEKKVALVGGLDFLGCDLTLRFLAEDYQVKVSVPPAANHKNLIMLSGLKTHKNLSICKVDVENQAELLMFLKDCPVVIHCGSPLKFSVPGKGIDLYIPVIHRSAGFLKIVSEAQWIRKVIIIVSPAVLISVPHNPIVPNHTSLKKLRDGSSGNIRPTFEKALYHASKAIESSIDNIPGNRCEVILVPPLEVSNNTLSNNKDSTSAGLQHIFSTKMAHDQALHQILDRKALNTMTNIDQLPDYVFQKARSNEEKELTL